MPASSHSWRSKAASEANRGNVGLYQRTLWGFRCRGSGGAGDGRRALVVDLLPGAGCLHLRQVG